MEAVMNIIEERLKKLEAMVFGPPEDDSGHDAPAQTLNPARMPAVPGMPIANYDPLQHQDDETDQAMAAEAQARDPMARMTVRAGEPALGSGDED